MHTHVYALCVNVCVCQTWKKFQSFRGHVLLIIETRLISIESQPKKIVVVVVIIIGVVAVVIHVVVVVIQVVDTRNIPLKFG